jgi:hypothetical protein
MAQAPARGGALEATAQPAAEPTGSARRGRPKGTGINDADTLAEIGRLLAADPDLRPTTAIKKVGVTDPSVVRRLREKLKLGDEGTAAQQGAQSSAVKPSSKSSGSVAAVKPNKPIATTSVGSKSATSPQALALAAALAEAAAPRRVDTPPAPLVPPTAPRPIAEADSPQTDAIEASADFMRASVEAASAVARLQIEMSEHARRLMQLSLRLREQTAITDALTLALASQRGDGGAKSDNT